MSLSVKAYCLDLYSPPFHLMCSTYNSSLSSTWFFHLRLLLSVLPYFLSSYFSSNLVSPYFSQLKLWKSQEKYFFTEIFMLHREWNSNAIPSLLQTLLAVLRQRLDIPAYPVTEEPSPSAFPANFTPLAYEGPDIEPDTDEVLGPIEAPFASETFRHNFSVGLMSDMFNKFGDPFHLYPHTPFQPVLPSESKFLGLSFRERVRQTDRQTDFYYINFISILCFLWKRESDRQIGKQISTI